MVGGKGASWWDREERGRRRRKRDGEEGREGFIGIGGRWERGREMGVGEDVCGQLDRRWVGLGVVGGGNREFGV